MLFATDVGESNIRVCGKIVPQYFNSGVLFINIAQWNKSKIGEIATDLVCKYQPKLPDQDALNAALCDRWQTLPEHFQSSWVCHPKTVFIHYVGAKPWEPWHFKHNPDAVNYFRQCAKIFAPNVSLWITFKPQKNAWINFSRYKTRKASKWIAKLMLKRKHYGACLHFYALHLRTKIKQKGIIGILLLRSNTRS